MRVDIDVVVPVASYDETIIGCVVALAVGQAICSPLADVLRTIVEDSSTVAQELVTVKSTFEYAAIQ